MQSQFKRVFRFRAAIRIASSRTFARMRFPVDHVFIWIFSILCAAAAFLSAQHTGLYERAAVAVLAGTAAHATYNLLRTLVPFVLRISFGDMLRIQYPFFAWLFLLAFMTALSAPVLRTFTALNVNSVQVTLTLVTLSSVLRFFQRGRLFRLVLAFCCAGASVGISSFGLLAPLVLVLVRHFVARLLFRQDGTMWIDRPNARVAEYYHNPAIGSRMKWIFMICFVVSCAVAFLMTFAPHGTLLPTSRIRLLWMRGINLDSAVVVAAVAAVPLFVFLRRIGRLSNTGVQQPMVELLAFLVVGFLSMVVLIRPAAVYTVFGLRLTVDDRMLSVAMVTCAFNALLAVIVLLIDIRCRNMRATGSRMARELQAPMRLTFSLACIAPVVVFTVVGFFAARRHPAFVRVLPRPGTYEIEMTLTPEEALHIYMMRNNAAMVEKTAKDILVQSPSNVRANCALGLRALAEGRVNDALVHAERIRAKAGDNAEALWFVSRAYAAAGMTEKAELVRAKIRHDELRFVVRPTH